MEIIPDTVRKNPWVQTFIVLTVFVAFLSFTFWIRDVLLPFFIAFIIAYMLDPVVDWLEFRFSLPRTLAVIVLLSFLSIILLGFFYYLTDQLIELVGELGELAEHPPEIRAWIESMVPETVRQYFEGYFSEIQPRQLIKRGIVLLREHVSGIADTLRQGTTYIWLLATRTFGVLGFLINATVVFFVAIYLLRDFDYIVKKGRSLIPHEFRDDIDDIVGEIDELMGAYFRGHLIICVTIGILYGGGYALVGLEGGFLIGLISGMLNVVPYLGPAIGFSAALLMALYQFGGSLWVLAIVGVYVAVQSLEGNILTPNIIGGAVGLNPVIVIFALMIFGKILGFLGLLVAIPLAAIVKVLLGRLIEQYKESSLYKPAK